MTIRKEIIEELMAEYKNPEERYTQMLEAE